MGFLIERRNDRESLDKSATSFADRELTSADRVQPQVSEFGALQGVSTYRDLPAFGLLQHASETIPNREAIIYDEHGWTYGSLNRDCLRAAAMLQRLGVQPGDRVGILLPNVPEYVIAANAIWRAGAACVAISPLMVTEEVANLLRQTDCRRVICLDVLSHLVTGCGEHPVQTLLVSIRNHLSSFHQLGYLWARRARTGHWMFPPTDACRWFWDEIERTDRAWQPISISPATDPAYILPTGGTTGAAKAVTLSHTNLVANAWQQYQWTRGSFAKEKMLAVLPFFHSYGMSATVMGGAAMGATLVLHHRFNTRQVIGLLEEHKPTVFHAVPAMLVAMNERFRRRAPSIEGLRWVISGGAPLEESVGREFARFTGAHVVEGYGLSEASPVTHVGDLFGEPRYGTIGYSLPATNCRIVDASDDAPKDDGERSLPDGEVGELLVRGPQVMLGYWNDPRATQAAVDRGWLHTGDLAVKSADGTFQIVGRKKDLIITSGFNVYPCEVEAVLREAEGVLDAAVIGCPDLERGEVVTAHVVLEPTAAWDEHSLRQHCEAHLSKHKRPRRYVHCQGDLPRNFLGKVIRRKLRESTEMPTED
jgi:long-chain acyl-CoA synthetase